VNLKHFPWSRSYEDQDLPHPERLGGYTPLTEAMIRKMTQSWFEQRIRKRWKGWDQIEVEEVHRPTPPIDYARWDEMRYLPTDNEDFPTDSEHFAEKAAFSPPKPPPRTSMLGLFPFIMALSPFLGFELVSSSGPSDQRAYS